jgi:hypothetical protein
LTGPNVITTIETVLVTLLVTTLVTTTPVNLGGFGSFKIIKVRDSHVKFSLKFILVVQLRWELIVKTVKYLSPRR